MFQRFVLAYIFVSFLIGLACLGVTLVLARRKDDHLARAFLVFYSVLSLLVISGLMLAFADAFPGEVNASGRFVFEYIESMPGFYGIMFALPFFLHRVYGVSSFSRDRFLLLMTLMAAAGQHITEYALDDKWDQRGDIIENVLFAGVMMYASWIAFSRFRSEGINRQLAGRILVLIGVGVPGMVYDIFLAETTGLRVYPITYCIFSVVVTWTLVHRPRAPQPNWSNPDCGLSNRETEVLQLVQLGLSNKGIGEKLHISPNTVKTHLRAIFEKTGVSSRFELIALVNEAPEDQLQIEDNSSL